MITNVFFSTTVIFLALGFYLLQEFTFLRPFRSLLIHTYGPIIGVYACLLFFNLFALSYLFVRKLLLKETGRKLAHVEKQLRAGDSISDELSLPLKRVTTMGRDLELDSRELDERQTETELLDCTQQGRNGSGSAQQAAPPEFDLAGLRERIDRAAEGSPTVATFVERLQKDNIRPIPSVQANGRWNGISYEFAGVRVKGSNLGRAFTANGLIEKKGIEYNPDRDNELLRSLASVTREAGLPVTRDRDDRSRSHPAIGDREEQVMWEAGRFRTIADSDLARSHYQGDYASMQQSLGRLQRLGFVERNTISLNGRGRTLSVVSLTRQGKQYLNWSSGHAANRDQAIYSGMVKPRELSHDAAIYRMYLAEAAKIEAGGGRVQRVILDYELKKKAYSPLAKAVDLPPLEYAERQQEIAAENDLSVVDGHIALPDLRIEYETPDGELRHLDLELATENYRGAHIQSKSGAGFKFYADTSSSRLAAVFDDHHLVAEILRP